VIVGLRPATVKELAEMTKENAESAPDLPNGLQLPYLAVRRLLTLTGRMVKRGWRMKIHPSTQSWI
jgi:hypothetical protein